MDEKNSIIMDGQAILLDNLSKQEIIRLFCVYEENVNKQITSDRHLIDQLNKDIERYERQSLKHKYTQIQLDSIRFLRYLLDKNKLSLNIFFILMEHANKNNEVMTTKNYLSKHLNVSIPTISKALKLLTEKKFIKEIKEESGSLMFILNSRVVWSSNLYRKLNDSPFNELIDIEPDDLPQEIKSKRLPVIK